MRELTDLALLMGAFVAGALVVGLGMTGLVLERTERAYWTG